MLPVDNVDIKIADNKTNFATIITELQVLFLLVKILRTRTEMIAITTTTVRIILRMIVSIWIRYDNVINVTTTRTTIVASKTKSNKNVNNDNIYIDDDTLYSPKN